MTDGNRFTHLFPMRWADMDANGHVNHALYLRYLEDARVNFLRHAHEYVTDVDMVVVARAEIDYRRQLVYRRDPLPIDVWVGRIGGASFQIAHQIYEDTDAGRIVYADAVVTMAAIDKASGHAKRVSDEMREYLSKYVA